MKLRTFLITAALLVLLLLPVVISGRRMAYAESTLASAKHAFDQTTRDVQEIAALRRQEERVGLAQRPTQDVIAQANAVLVQVGLPSQRLKALSPESDVAVNSTTGHPEAGPQYRRQSVRLVLEDLSVQEIGSYLAAWQKSPGGRIWTPIQIELTHNRSEGSRNADLNRYDLTVLITAVYVNQIREAS